MNCPPLFSEDPCSQFVARPPLSTRIGKALRIGLSYAAIGAAYGAAATGLCAHTGTGIAAIGAIASMTGLAPLVAGAAVGAGLMLGTRALSKKLALTLSLLPPVVAGSFLLENAVGWENIKFAGQLAAFAGASILGVLSFTAKIPNTLAVASPHAIMFIPSQRSKRTPSKTNCKRCARTKCPSRFPKAQR